MSVRFSVRAIFPDGLTIFSGRQGRDLTSLPETEESFVVSGSPVSQSESPLEMQKLGKPPQVTWSPLILHFGQNMNGAFLYINLNEKPGRSVSVMPGTYPCASRTCQNRFMLLESEVSDVISVGQTHQFASIV